MELAEHLFRREAGRMVAVLTHIFGVHNLALRAIADSDRLANYPFYYAAFGESELQAGRHKIATDYFRAALELARNPMERQFFEQRIDACNRAASSGSGSESSSCSSRRML